MDEAKEICGHYEKQEINEKKQETWKETYSMEGWELQKM